MTEASLDSALLAGILEHIVSSTCFWQMLANFLTFIDQAPFPKFPLSTYIREFQNLDHLHQVEAVY